MNVLTFENVDKGYPLPSGVMQPILKGLSFDLAAGESMAVVGPSGCGKSTLLNVAGTLDVVDAGRVLIAGTDPAGRSEKALAALRADGIGFVFQAHHLLPQCTALENVLVPLLADAPKVTEEQADYGRELLKRVGLGKRMDHFPGQMSGGECQRVAVVRALIRKPKLLLADEPTGALDGVNAEKLTDLLLELGTGPETALLMVTHADRLAAKAKRQLSLGC